MPSRPWPRASLKTAFTARRRRLEHSIDGPVLLASGFPRSRNYAANTYPFRAESHFLYLVGRSLPAAALLLDSGQTVLFVREPSAEDALWGGATASLHDLESELGLSVRPLDELTSRLAGATESVATLPPNDDTTAAWLGSLLGRPIRARSGATLEPNGSDARLADAMIAIRLTHDEAAVDQLRQAAAVTANAHAAGMRATHSARREADILGAMLAEIVGAGMDVAYAPIVTVHGEILHNEIHTGLAEPGALLLADVGAETPEGWAADVTRTWPLSGRFSDSQRALYEVVLAAQTDAIQAVRPGARFRDLHERAALKLLEGLVELGILRGQIESLYERGAHALFFCHGIGHLLGLDVHDMEDLGDRAGYAPGRSRPSRFGDSYLRLDRDLSPGMAVTIEPGLYQIPAILENHDTAERFRDVLNARRLAQFADVRGIRIEDDVLVLPTGCEVLTQQIPKNPSDIEAWLRSPHEP